ncbi:MAG: hypothetical protein M1828_002290 [Chrysothrix sp. TS-e1954]|nr:MAG: hypothetical protein M1828_002290 [Chrysothrix sp. TS-e1954]
MASSSSSGSQPQNKEKAHHRYEYGNNPLSHQYTNESTLGPNAALFQPGLYKASFVDPKRANPVPLGLSGFALTTFVLSIVNLGTRGVATPNVVVGPALAYGGLIQLLAGMWEMGFGNTFAAWALSSYGGFWISLGIIFTPGGFDIAAAYGGETGAFYTAFAFYIYGWMIFTIIVWIATLRSTIIFSLLLMTVWLAFLCLATGYLYHTGDGLDAKPHLSLIRAGGGFGIVAAFLAWWVMIAGVLDKGNSFFTVPVFPFPWSLEGRSASKKTDEDVDVEQTGRGDT